MLIYVIISKNMSSWYSNCLKVWRKIKKWSASGEQFKCESQSIKSLDRKDTFTTSSSVVHTNYTIFYSEVQLLKFCTIKYRPTTKSSNKSLFLNLILKYKKLRLSCAKLGSGRACQPNYYNSGWLLGFDWKQC